MGVRQERPRIARALDKGVTALFSIMGKVVSRPRHENQSTPTDQKNKANSYETAISKARAAYDSGQLGEALHLFGIVIELSPHEPWGWHGRGDCLQLTGEYSEALKAYEKAVEYGGGAYSYLGLGNSYRGMNNIQEAKSAWEKALELEPGLELAKTALLGPE